MDPRRELGSLGLAQVLVQWATVKDSRDGGVSTTPRYRTWQHLNLEAFSVVCFDF